MRARLQLISDPPLYVPVPMPQSQLTESHPTA